MNEFRIERWNELVSPNNKVFILDHFSLESWELPGKT
jgi:hypothetical protein